MYTVCVIVACNYYNVLLPTASEHKVSDQETTNTAVSIVFNYIMYMYVYMLMNSNLIPIINDTLMHRPNIWL